MITTIGRDLLKLIELAFHAQKPILLIGATGVGKSEILAQAAKDFDIGFVVRDLSLLEPPDLIGIPHVEEGRTVYAPPSFLPKEEEEGNGGLLCFEELNRAPKYMQGPCLQLLTARVLNDYRLPDGWLPAAAINPDDDNYFVDELDMALLARFMRIEVEPDANSWAKWAEANGVHAAVVSYVRNTRDIFDGEFSNPRAWKNVSDLLQTGESMGADRGTLLPAIAGVVGDAHAHAFFSTYDGSVGELPTAEELLTAYSRTGRAVRAIKRAGDVASLDAIARSVLLHLQDPSNEEEVKSNDRQVANLRKLLGDLPPDTAKPIRQDYPWCD